MSAPAPNAPAGGETATSAATRLLGTLPAPYLALVLVNIVVIGGLIYMEDRTAANRSQLITSLLDSCVGKANQLADLTKQITEQGVRFRSMDERERQLEVQMASILARFDAIDQASRAELHQPKRTK